MTQSWIARSAMQLAVVTTVALSTTAAQAQTFGAKPGAWETTVTMTGITIPPEALAKMSPEQRDAVQKRLGAGAGKPTVRKSCVKKEDLDQDRFVKSRDASCTVKTVTRTATKLVLATTCSATTPPSTGTITFEAKTPESVVGSIDQQRGDGRPFHISLVGRWLGPSCDGVDADQD